MNWNIVGLIHLLLNGALPVAGILLAYFSYVWYSNKKSTAKGWSCLGFCLFAVGQVVAFGISLNTAGVDFSYAAIFQLFHAISAAGIIIAAIFYGKVVLGEKRAR